MIEGLLAHMEEAGQPGLDALDGAVRRALGKHEGACLVVGIQRLKSRVFRCELEARGARRSLVLKRLDPATAERNRWAVERWLPAMGVADLGPPLLAAAAEESGRSVWHVYDDLGDQGLDPEKPNRYRVGAVAEAIARLHTRSAGHPLLPECRRRGADLGIAYFVSNLRDAIRGLEALRPPAVEIGGESDGVRDRLLARLLRLEAERQERVRVLQERGGLEVLLHGDLWTTNAFVRDGDDGLRVRLIDWDHVGVGFASYDLSTFLYRFPAGERGWILERYREAVAPSVWRLPPASDLNLLFDTAECARYADRIIWPAAAFAQERADWALAELAEIEQWFDALRPVLAA